MSKRKTRVNQITAWSFSRYSVYKLCPLKAKLAFIDKIKEPPNDAMARGAEIHDKAEAYIKGALRQLPTELKLFKDEIKMLRELYKKKLSGIVVEDTWAFTKDWDETVWNDWVRCWVRIKLDCAYYEDTKKKDVMIIDDWKSGKFRPEKNDEYIEQLELYGLAALLLHPHVEVVKPRLAYTDLGRLYPDTDEGEEEIIFTRKDLPRLKKLWEKRVRPMLKDSVFAPRPNNLCNWCHYRKSNKVNGGGQCKY